MRLFRFFGIARGKASTRFHISVLMNCRLEVVAICDRLVALGAAELEHEIGRETSGIALDLLR